jgi:acyl dehydratase
MTAAAFTTPIEQEGTTLIGPWRRPLQMLAEQEYDSHASIHDDATAQKLGFRGGTIEGPTHFSQFAPLAAQAWGNAFFETGCLSAHYRSPVFEGEEVRALLTVAAGAKHGTIRMEKRDGTEVLAGSASIGTDAPRTALETRLTELKPLADPVIAHDVKVGMRTAPQAITMGAEQNMGALYPFSLKQKLGKISEPSPWYVGGDNPWGRAIVPFEMLSVLFQYRAREDGLPMRGPAVGLFADQEIRLFKGPLFVGEAYEVTREVVALSGSKRTESVWARSTVTKPGSSEVLATMLLNMATMKESYARYAEEHKQLYG